MSSGLYPAECARALVGATEDSLLTRTVFEKYGFPPKKVLRIILIHGLSSQNTNEKSCSAMPTRVPSTMFCKAVQSSNTRRDFCGLNYIGRDL